MFTLLGHLDRYVVTSLARAAATAALVLSALLLAVDALDPSARDAPASEIISRAPSLVAVALVVAALLAPALTVASLERSGALRALRSGGCHVGRTLAPWSLLTAVGLALTCLALGALPSRPGLRPPPLSVTPFGAPHSGRWVFSNAGARFALRDSVATPRKPLPDSVFREPVAAQEARTPDTASVNLPLCALVGGAMVSAELWRSDARSLRGLWAVCAMVLLGSVVLTVLLANANAMGQ